MTKDARGTFTIYAVVLALLAFGALLAYFGGQSLYETVRDRGRVESTCTVIGRQPPRRGFVALRVRLDLAGTSHDSKDWVNFWGTRPEVGSKVVCYYAPHDPEDITFDRAPFGADVPVTLFGLTIVVAAIALLVGLAREGKRRRVVAKPIGSAAAPATDGDDPYRGAAPHSVRPSYRLEGVLMTMGGRRPFTVRFGCFYAVVPLFLVSIAFGGTSPIIGVVGWALCVAIVLQPILARRRARGALPVVEIDRHPAALGQPLVIRVIAAGEQVSVDVECARGQETVLVGAVPASSDDAGAADRRFIAELPAQPAFRFDAPPSEDVRWSVLLRVVSGAEERVARYPFLVT